MAEYIERNGLLEWVRKFYPEEKVFASAVINAPTANVQEVRHGKWIPIKNRFFSSTDGRGGNVVKCSVCGEPSSCRLSTPYCSICGAKMDEE